MKRLGKFIAPGQFPTKTRRPQRIIDAFFFLNSLRGSKGIQNIFFAAYASLWECKSPGI